MKDDVFSFINKGLKSYADGGYTSKLKDICKSLNELLNKHCDDDYSKHIENIRFDYIQTIEHLFVEMKGRIYINLSDEFLMLNENQDFERLVGGGHSLRDHFYHSIQCFLLAISLVGNLKLELPAFADIDMTTVLFIITVYHDLGYLYKINGNNGLEINNDFLRLFTDAKVSDRQRQSMFKVLDIDIYKYTIEQHKFESLVNVLSPALDDVADIWKSPLSQNDKYILSSASGFDIKQFPDDCEKHHSYQSALLLHRLYRIKEIILNAIKPNNCKNGTIKLSDRDDECFFLDCIKAILLHDFSIDPPMSFKKNEYSFLLMIADELQTYGRLYECADKKGIVINPSKVGFDTENNKIKLIRDNKYCTSLLSEEQKRAYDKHTNQSILDELRKKIDCNDLKRIFV